ncbi:MAG: T9SS type A sorting domain-containing protein [Bacteroidetes bacterium]|nr:T9SS type A sorting domain-containing protein [Bacteroidota bacterium]
MKYNILLFVLLFWNIHLIVAQPLTLNWQSCYGTSSNDVVQDIVSTGDGYIIAGSNSAYKLLLVKTDLDGNFVWEKQYWGSDFGEGAFRIFPADVGNYFVVATASSSDGDVTYDPYPDANNCWILKIDGEGNKIWDKIFGGNCNDKGWTGAFVSDTSVVSFGGTCSTDGDISVNHGFWDGWMIKVDKEGNKVWDFSMGNSSLDFASAIIETSDKGFLAATYSYYGDVGNIECSTFDPTLEFGQAVLVKLDENANIVWQHCYGGSKNESIMDIIETEDGFLLACYADSNDGDVQGAGYHIGYDNGGNVTSDIWLVKTDFEGNIVWSKCYGGYYTESPSRVFRTEDGGYIVFGRTSSNDGDVSGYHNEAGWYRDIWVIKVSSTGQLQWQQCIGGAGNEDIANAVIQLEGGKYVFSATLNSNNTGDINCITDPNSWSVWLVEVTDTTVGLPEQNRKQSIISCFPNPANSWVNFEYELPEGIYNAHIEITNTLGLPVGRLSIQSNTTNQWFDTRYLLQGFYLCTLQTNHSKQSIKLIVKH